jgi:hypothetical protein
VSVWVRGSGEFKVSSVFLEVVSYKQLPEFYNRTLTPCVRRGAVFQNGHGLISCV